MSDERPERGPFARFLAGAGSWFLAWGMQHLVFQWLVVEVLQERPARVGLAQMAVLLLLPAGAAADRIDRTRLLIALHLLSAALFAGLGAVVAAGRLTYPGLLGFAVAVGVTQAFQVPAREGQLHEVARGAIARGVVGSNLVQQAAQALGGLLAGFASALGGPFVLGVQSLLIAVGAAAQRGLRRASARDARARREARASAGLRAGVAGVARDPVLRGTFLLTAAVGLLFVGPYAVVLPLLVRDFYGGGPREMGILAAMLPIGGILAGAFLYGRGGLGRAGRALLLGQAFSALCIVGIGLALPFVGAAACVLGWGLGSGWFLNAGRTLFHARTPDADRAQVLAVYSFGILGAGPVGSLLTGLLVDALGSHAALRLQGGAMLVGVLLAARSAPLRRASTLAEPDRRPMVRGPR